MLRRFNTGYEDGNYSLPAGHVEPHESLTETLSREIFEEIGISVAQDELSLVHLMHRKNDNRLDFFFTTTTKVFKPINKELNKADDLSWFPLTALPVNTVPCIRTALDSFVNKILYSEFNT